MSTVLLKSLGFIVIILMGYFSVSSGLITRADGKRLGKIIMNFTLPCTVIVSFISVKFSLSLLIAFIIGFVYNIGALVFSRFVTSFGYDKKRAATTMLCCNSLNVGSFALPFCQSFFPIAAVGYLAMLDASNCIMSLGIGPAVAGTVASKKNRFDFIAFVKKLFRSIPLDFYIIGGLLSIFKIRIPSEVTLVIGPIAQANGFLAMFMIGTQLDLKIENSQIKAAIRIFLTRFFVAALIILYLYLFSASESLMKIAITICLLAPPTSVTVVLVQDIDCDTKLAAMVSSLAIPISIVIYLIIMLIVG